MGSYDIGVAPMKAGYPAPASSVNPQTDTSAVGDSPLQGGCSQNGQGTGQTFNFGQQNGGGNGGGFGGVGHHHHHHHHHGGGGLGAFGGGGRQSLTSAQQADQAFSKFDTNGDGSITKDELVAALDAIRGAAATAAPAATDATDATDATTAVADPSTTDATSVDSSVAITPDAATDASTDASLATLLASNDTSSTDMPVVPTSTDDSTSTTIG